MIPRVIHYCWFGKKRKPKLVLDCIESWRNFLPDYKIVEWNESNSDLSHHFALEAYKKRKWAFVADIVRLQVLYSAGGIYLDTDIILVKKLDGLLQHNCFFGAEDNQYVNCAIVGAEKGNDLICEILNAYREIIIHDKQNWESITIPIIATKIIKKNVTVDLDLTSTIHTPNITIYNKNYFYPLPNHLKNDRANFKKYITIETYAVHLWSSSWVEYNEYQFLKQKKYWKALHRISINFFSTKFGDVQYLKSIIRSFINSLSTFIVMLKCVN